MTNSKKRYFQTLDKSDHRMKNYLFTLLALLSINCFSQELTKYQLDSTVAVSIPANYTLTDTMGVKAITAEIDNGLIIVTTAQNQGKIELNIQDEAGLIKSYKGFIVGVLQSQKGVLVQQEILEKNGLKYIRATYKATQEGEKHIRHCLVLCVNHTIYTMNFWELESMDIETEDRIADVRERFFTSLEFPKNLTIKDQLHGSYEDSIKDDGAYILGEYMGYGIMLLLVIGIIIWISKKVK